LVNHISEGIVVSREFSSNFEPGESWGYNRFFKIDLLDTEGYLDPEDESLKFRFHIRPPTYYQKSRIQSKFIQHLESLGSQIDDDEVRDKAELRTHEFHTRKNFYDSDENPLERISADEETKADNATPSTLVKTLKRLAKLRTPNRRSKEERVSREDRVNRISELNTVFQKYMVAEL